MELPTEFIAPVIGLWVIHNAIFSSARFVNEMRETVVSGRYEREKITPEHGRAILLDWLLCVAATIAVCLIFAGIVIVVSFGLAQSPLLQRTGYAIAAYPVMCAFGFLFCSLGDLKLMARAIDDTGLSPSRWWSVCRWWGERGRSIPAAGTGT